MPSSTSASLRLELMASGEKANTWGDITNTNLGTLLEQAICGYQVIILTSNADKTLTPQNWTTVNDEARSAVLNFTGTISATVNIIAPSVPKIYIIRNSTTGGRSIVIKTLSGAGITVANGKTAIVYYNGSGFSQYTPALAETATTAVNLSGGTAWLAAGRTDSVANMLSWKNYGNGYVIFDASAGTAPNGATVNNTNATTVWGATHPTLMGWNGAGTYGVRVDSARLADTATTAAACSGNAATATLATNATNAYACSGNAASATLATNATNAYACLGNAATATSATNVSGLGITGGHIGVGYNRTSAGTASLTFHSASPYTTAYAQIYQRATDYAFIIQNIAADLISITNTTNVINLGSTGNLDIFGDNIDIGGTRILARCGGPGKLGVKLVYNTDAWATTSDERLKDIIEPITDAVTKVNTLRSVMGKFKDDVDQTRRSFLIAQDVQAVLPEAVSIDNDEIGTLSLRYTEVIPLLVAAIKELSAKVTALEAK